MLKAGPGAFREIHTHGFDVTRIGTIAGASGGAKWLVLSQLDRVIISDILPRLSGPVHLLGSSIGAWRFVCYGQPEPLAALERFESAYLEQSYSEAPDIHEITATSRSILRSVLGNRGAACILAHRQLRLHVLTVRSRHLLQKEHPAVLAPSLLLAGTLNAVSRKSLGLFFERALFYDARDLPPFFAPSGFPLQRVPLTRENLEDAVLATGSIPLVLTGVRDIQGARAGVYRDGGIIDYHLDLPHSASDRFTLYPHFYDYIVPGWFDKRLPWRRARSANFDRTILVCPSAEFVGRLAGGKIPDRTDFYRLSQPDRLDTWRSVVGACKALADELHDLLVTERIPARIQPL